MACQKNSGIAALADVIDARIREFSDKPLNLDFGEIREDGSLRTNTFPVPIPKSAYRVCRNLTLGETGSAFCNVNVMTEQGTGTGHAYIPEKMRKLKPRDRVLVAWVQNIAVVIDIILEP